MANPHNPVTVVVGGGNLVTAVQDGGNPVTSVEGGGNLVTLTNSGMNPVTFVNGVPGLNGELLMESGDALLQENGAPILLE